jgi:hypothetical protein
MFMRRGKQSKLFALIGSVVLLGVLFVFTATPSRADVLRQSATPDRPTLTPTPNTPPAAVPVVANANAALSGYVFVNGDVFVPAAGVPVRLSGEGFELVATTDVNGYYQFEQVGEDVSKLSVGGDGSAWKASVDGVMLSVRPGLEFVVNFSASQASPQKGPNLLDVSVSPASIGAGHAVTVTLKAHNSTQQKLSGVWLTQRAPDGLSIAGATTDRGDALAFGNLAMANVGDLAPGDAVTFNIVLSSPSEGGAHGALSLMGSMFSRESVAVQDATTLTATNGPVTLPVTGAGEWLAGVGAALVVIVFITHRLRRSHERPYTT